MRIGLNTTNPKCRHLLPPHPMAQPGCAATFSTTTAHRFRPPPLLASSSTIPSPSPSQPKRIKIKRRKNHLRPKILKTLTKPFPTAPLPEINPPPPTTSTTIVIPIETRKSDAENDVVLEPELNETQSVPVHEGAVIGEFSASGSVGKLFSARSVLKFCGYFVLVFVFQTICAVMILGNTGFDDEDEKKRKQRDAYIRQLESGVGVLDEVEVEMRVNEIREMARAVRESERREQNNEGGGGADGESEREIEKEIGERLVKLERKLNSKREKLPNLVIDYSGYGSDDEDNVDDDNGSDDDDLRLKKGVMPLMFKKKFWFKSLGINTGRRRSSPKGFGSSQSGFRGVNVNGGSKASDFEGVPVQNNGNELDEVPKRLTLEIRFGNIFLLLLE